jgi:hypothetical protein
MQRLVSLFASYCTYRRVGFARWRAFLFAWRLEF